jgi:hypothetical protein
MRLFKTSGVPSLACSLMAPYISISLSLTHTHTVLFMHSLLCVHEKKNIPPFIKYMSILLKSTIFFYNLKNEYQMLLLRDFSSSQVKLKKYSNDFKTSNQVRGWEPVLSICIVFRPVFFFSFLFF